MAEEQPLLIPFSTGLIFSRRIPFSESNIFLATALAAVILSCIHLLYTDASGILLLFLGLVLVSFSISATTLGLNVLCFFSCFGALQSFTSALSVLATNSWKLNLLVPEGKLLLSVYFLDCLLCSFIFVLTFRLLYLFDPCRPLVETVQPLEEQRADRQNEESLQVWQHTSSIQQVHIP